MTSPLMPEADRTEFEETDGVAALAGAAVTGLVLAMGFVALMARIAGPESAQASLDIPPVMIVVPAAEVDPPQGTKPVIQGLYDESGSH